MAIEASDRWLPEAGETPRQTLTRLCVGVRDAVGARRVGLWLHDTEAGTVVPYVAIPDRIPESVRGRVEDLRVAEIPILREVVDEQRVVVVTDPAEDPRVPELFTQDEDVGPFRLVPLTAGEVVGFLTFEPAAIDTSPIEDVLPHLAAVTAQARLWRRAEGRRRRAELLHEVVEAGAAAGSLRDLLSTVCERLAAGLRARRAAVFLVDRDGRLMPKMARFADTRRDESQWEDFIDPEAPFLLGQQVIESGEPFLLRDAHAPEVGWSDEDLWWRDRFGIGSAAMAPIADVGGVIGVISIDSPHRGRFSEEDARLLTAVGTQLSVVIERARSAQALRERVRAATAVRYLLELGSSADDVHEAAETLARVVHQALETEHTVVYLRDADGRISDIVAIDVPGEYEAVLREIIAERTEEVSRFLNRMLEPGVVLVDDTAESDLLPEELVEALSLRSYVSLPILAPDRPLGIIECGTTRTHRNWTEEDRRLVEQLALEGSLVLEAAALREADRRRLAELSHQAFHDELTGLPNRTLLMDRIAHALARAERNPEAVAVLFVDLDRFKPVNDRLGHDAGDTILVEVARRIETSVRPGDTVARLAGDEFVVVLEDVSDREEAAHVASRVVEELGRPYETARDRVTVTASVGIALGMPGEVDAEDLLRRADIAMYRVKASGGAAHEFHEVLGGAPSVEPSEIERDLAGAAERGEMHVRYQAIQNLHDGSIVAVEALIRWVHPTVGVIGPNQFLPVAEQAGLMHEITEWSLRAICQEVASWWRDGLGEVPVAVNIAARPLFAGEVHTSLRQVLTETGLPAVALLVEVNEYTVVTDIDGAVDALARIRDLGVRTVLDDFGSGNASLRDVQRLPLDVVKMDPSIVDGVASETGDNALARAILDLGETLSLEVVAEGIETDRQLDALRQLGCRFGQGYLLHRPSEPEKVRGLLNRQKQDASTSSSSLG